MRSRCPISVELDCGQHVCYPRVAAPTAAGPRVARIRIFAPAPPGTARRRDHRRRRVHRAGFPHREPGQPGMQVAPMKPRATTCAGCRLRNRPAIRTRVQTEGWPTGRWRRRRGRRQDMSNVKIARQRPPCCRGKSSPRFGEAPARPTWNAARSSVRSRRRCRPGDRATSIGLCTASAPPRCGPAGRVNTSHQPARAGRRIIAGRQPAIAPPAACDTWPFVPGSAMPCSSATAAPSAPPPSAGARSSEARASSDPQPYEHAVQAAAADLVLCAGRVAPHASVRHDAASSWPRWPSPRAHGRRLNPEAVARDPLTHRRRARARGWSPTR